MNQEPKLSNGQLILLVATKIHRW